MQILGIMVSTSPLHANQTETRNSNSTGWAACKPDFHTNDEITTLKQSSSTGHMPEYWQAFINPLRPNDAIWRHRSGSTLAQVMACCLMAPSHYLNQCWLNISVALWHSAENNFTRNAQDICPWYQFKKYWFKTSTTSSRDQWVEACIP